MRVENRWVHGRQWRKVGVTRFQDRSHAVVERRKASLEACLYIYLEESVTRGTSCFSRLELLTGEIEEVLFSRVVEFKGEGEKQGLAEG